MDAPLAAEALKIQGKVRGDEGTMMQRHCEARGKKLDWRTMLIEERSENMLIRKT